MREKTIEKKLADAVKSRGGLAPKFTSPGFDGMPDRIVLLPGGRMAFVEVKAPGKAPRPLQEARHRLLRQLGFKVYVLDGEDQIGGILDEICTPYALKRPYRKNAKFILNDQTIASLRKLKDLNGQYMWQPALISGEPDRLLGYEVLTSPFAPVAEAGKPFIAFGDFKYYNIGDRGTRSFQELKELFAGNGMVGYVAKERVDGKLILPEAVQLLTLKGTASSGS